MGEEPDLSLSLSPIILGQSFALWVVSRSRFPCDLSLWKTKGMWVVISKDYYPELEHTKPEQQLTEVTMVPCKMVSTSTIQVKKGNDDLMSSHAGLKNWATDGWGLQQGGGLSLERWSCFKSSWQCGVGPLRTGLQIFFFFFFGLRFVVFRWMGLKDSLNFGCKFFFQWMGYSGLTTVVLQMRPDEWPQQIFLWL